MNKQKCGIYWVQYVLNVCTSHVWEYNYIINDLGDKFETVTDKKIKQLEDHYLLGYNAV
jgi:hypothetical protein